MARREGSVTRQELRVFLSEDWPLCGCGSPPLAAGALLRLLRLHPLFDHRDEFEEWVPDDGLQYLLLYGLASAELTEHGSTVDAGWLTEKGAGVRDALSAEEGDRYESLFADHCVHGYDVGDPNHSC